MKLFKIKGTSCHVINVTFMSSPKDGLLNLSNSNTVTFLVFPALEKKMIKTL